MIEGVRLIVRVVRPGQGFRKFRELPWNEQLLFSEAYFLHLATGLILKVIPFRWIPGVFSSRQFETPMKGKSRTRSVGEDDQSRIRTCPDEVGSVGTPVSSRQSEDIELISMSVKRAGRVSPWKNRCLVSSLAGRCMLRRRKIDSQISLGLAKDNEGRPVAHAWLKSGEIELVARNGDYTVLYTF